MRLCITFNDCVPLYSHFCPHSYNIKCESKFMLLTLSDAGVSMTTISYNKCTALVGMLIMREAVHVKRGVNDKYVTFVSIAMTLKLLNFF